WFKAWLEQRAEASGSIDMIRNAYSYAHFLLVIGVVGVAAALETSIAHAGEAFSAPAAASLVFGTVGYVGGVALLTWMAGRFLLRARITVLATAVVFSVAAVALEVRGALVIALAAAALVLIAILEHPSPVPSGPE
ncbi:MAG: low temperature requirement protein A, partial [Acidimicrobiia bacterium]